MPSAPTYRAPQIDKEFEPPEASANPYPQSDNSVLIWQAVLNALSVLAFLAGPGGIVASAGLVFVSSALSAVPSSNKGALDGLKAIGDLIGGKLLDHELGKRVAHVIAYVKFIDQHRDLFDALELDVTGDHPVCLSRIPSMPALTYSGLAGLCPSFDLRK
jgi:hypothetical protein